MIVTAEPTTQEIGAYYLALGADPCAYCGQRFESKGKAGRDHIEPRSRGGEDTWENKTACCPSCNQSKRDVSLLGFLLWRRIVPDWYAVEAAMRGARAVGVPA